MPNLGATVTLIHGDTQQLLGELVKPTGRGLRDMEGRLLKGCDAVITDPPYNVNLDGEREWDDFDVDQWKKGNEMYAEWTRGWAYPLHAQFLRAGGHLISFSASRTYHAMAWGVEQAGFEITNQLAWLYGTSQVKHKCALQSSFEPMVLARGTRGVDRTTLEKLFKKEGRGMLHAQDLKKDLGKHPRNVDVVDEDIFSHAYDDELDAQIKRASAFFYVSKPTPAEKDRGCDTLPTRLKEGNLSLKQGRCPSCGEVEPWTGTCSKCGTAQVHTGIAGGRATGKNIHPTVKPLDLMRRLVRLVTKPGAVVIDPFMGSGTTGVACVLEGRSFIGIEREADFLQIAKARLAQALRDAGDEAQATAICPPGTELPDFAAEGNLVSRGRTLVCTQCGRSGFMRGAKNCHTCGGEVKEAA